MAKKFEATLRRGTTYTVRGIKFEKGIPQLVDEDLKEYLEESAVDVIGTDDDETIERAKFTFGEVADEAPSARKRTRKPAGE